MSAAGALEAAPLRAQAPRLPAALEGGGRIYDCTLMHLRLAPRRHQFRYRISPLLLDVDRLEQTLGALRMAGRNRFAPLAHHDRDHGPRDGGPLRPWVEAQLARLGLPAPAHIGLLALPRALGWAFNPLSLYYCWDAEARLSAVVAEVKNTFGDQHAYVLEGDAARAPDAPLRAARDKHFFVSPFMDMAQRYRFELFEPGETLRIRIRQGAPGAADRMIATQTGTARALSDPALARMLLRAPLQAVSPMAAIHWQALRLALKRVPFLGHPGDENVYAPGADAPGG